MNGIYEVTGLDAVGAYILDGSGTYLTGDEGEVLQAVPAIVNGVLYKVVMCDAGSYTYQYAVLILGKYFDILYLGKQDNTGEV